MRAASSGSTWRSSPGERFRWATCSRRCIGAWGERLESLPSWDARFDLLERILAESLRATDPRTDVVAWAVRRIEERAGATEIRSLCREVGYSPKHVIDLFRQRVGVPPKLYAQIVRFDGMLRRLRSGARGTLTELALDCGYYDQSHLARDVRRFTGATPADVRDLRDDLLAGAWEQVNSVQEPGGAAGYPSAERGSTPRESAPTTPQTPAQGATP